MAEVAAPGYVFLLVAVHTHRHGRRDLFRQTVTLLDRTVAVGAIDALGDVVFVAEEHEIRDAIDAHPLEGFALAMEFGKRANRRAFRPDRLMTEHALLARRQPGSFLSFGATVTIAAGNAR